MWTLCDRTFSNRLIPGTEGFPSREIALECVSSTGAELVTVAFGIREPERENAVILRNQLRELGMEVLPRTSGCRTAREAVETARKARELLGTKWVQLDVQGDDISGSTDTAALVEAAAELVRSGFEVFPCATEDRVVARRLLEAGCRVIMPCGAPRGSGIGLSNAEGLQLLRVHFPEAIMIIDDGMARPSDAARAMEMGFDGVFINHAMARARDPVSMAEAFADAVVAGRMGYEAELDSGHDEHEGFPPPGFTFPL